MELVATLLVPTTFVLFIVLERLFPGRPMPKVKGWAMKGTIFFVIAGVLNAALPPLLVGSLGKHAPFHLASLGTWLGAAVAFAITDAILYGLHRLMHVIPFVWRWTHQMHHSAERVDMFGFAYFHPTDMIVNVASTTVIAVLLGVTPDAAALAGYLGFLYGAVQHLNVKTPKWLGLVMIRPEAHAIHHARGVHAYNYGNLPIWDVLFGTYRNPAAYDGAPAGFWDGASAKVGAMLIGRDVGEPDSQQTTVRLQSNPTA
jgi:sterol desaturase/sphingolipid hydroxylase (fatty acid hydroxylase superfamily)